MNKLNSLCIFYDADFPTQPGGAQKRLFELGLLGKEKYNEVLWVSFRFWKETASVYDGIKFVGALKKPNFYDKDGKRNASEPILYLLNCILTLPKYYYAKTWVIGQWPLLHIIPLVIIGLILRKNIYIEWWETLQKQWLKRGFLGRLGALVERTILWSGRYVNFVVDCEAEKRLLLDVNPNANVTVIENGVDTKFFKKKQDIKKYDFISLGRLKDHKRVDLLIDAIDIYIKKTKHNDVRVSIVGDGPEKDTLIDQINKLNLSENIVMHGFVEKYENIANILLQSKVGVLTTVAGGSGNVTINELFAAGLPVLAIGSDEGIDLSYINESINGYITETVSPKELADLMEKILSNQTKLKEMSSNLFKNNKELDWKNKLAQHPSI